MDRSTVLGWGNGGFWSQRMALKGGTVLGRSGFVAGRQLERDWLNLLLLKDELMVGELGRW